MKFIELRYGMGDLGKSICNRKDVEDGELFIQWEMIPVDAIKDAQIILPQKRNIRIMFERNGKLRTVTEYYKNTIDCIKRWVMITRACGITVNDKMHNPIALPVDAEEMQKNDAEESKDDRNNQLE